jgi:hypothetical protein
VRAPSARPRSHDDFDSAEVLGCAGPRVHEGEERNSCGANLWEQKRSSAGAHFWARGCCVSTGPRRGYGTGVHLETMLPPRDSRRDEALGSASSPASACAPIRALERTPTGRASLLPSSPLVHALAHLLSSSPSKRRPQPGGRASTSVGSSGLIQATTAGVSKNSSVPGSQKATDTVWSKRGIASPGPIMPRFSAVRPFYPTLDATGCHEAHESSAGRHRPCLVSTALQP